MEGLDTLTESFTQGNALHWQQERVLVTGATGLVGSWLVKHLLRKGAFVAVLVRDADPQSEFYRSGDFRHTSVINGPVEDIVAIERGLVKHEVTSVFHLAAQPIVGAAQRAPLATFEANIRGTYNLLEACRHQSGLVRRVVVASSDKAYGSQSTLPYTEEMPLKGTSPYDVSKSCADLVAQAYAETYGMAIGIARCGNIFGGGDLNWNRIVPGTVRSYYRGERPMIRSDGTYTRDYVYVKDAVDAYIRLAEQIAADRLNGQAFNFSTETPVTVLEIVQVIAKLMHCEHLEPRILNSTVGEIQSQYLSAQKARNLLSWQPSYDLTTGLVETIDWYKQFLQDQSQ